MMQRIIIPQDILKLARDKPLLIQMGNGQQIFGILRNYDIYFNITFSDCTVVELNGDTHKQQLIRINGAAIESFQLSDDVVQAVDKAIAQ